MVQPQTGRSDPRSDRPANLPTLQGAGVRERLSIIAWVGAFLASTLVILAAAAFAVVGKLSGHDLPSLWSPAFVAVMVLSGLIAHVFDKSVHVAVGGAFVALVMLQAFLER